MATPHRTIIHPQHATPRLDNFLSRSIVQTVCSPTNGRKTMFFRVVSFLAILLLPVSVVGATDIYRISLDLPSRWTCTVSASKKPGEWKLWSCSDSQPGQKLEHANIWFNVQPGLNNEQTRDKYISSISSGPSPGVFVREDKQAYQSGETIAPHKKVSLIHAGLKDITLELYQYRKGTRFANLAFIYGSTTAGVPFFARVANVNTDTFLEVAQNGDRIIDTILASIKTR